MVNEHERWTRRLSEMVDGTLDPGERAAVEAHLAECDLCREVRADLRILVEEARGLGPVSPSRNLWPDIEARLAPRDARVIPLSTARVDGEGADIASAESRPSPDRGRRGLFLSAPQIAAAVLVLVAGSSLATWAARPAAPGPAPATTGEAGAVRPAGTVAEPPPELASELAALHDVLDEAAEELDPETRRIIAKNLAVIEGAIEDSRRALAQDPSNDFLRQHLDRTWERKLSYLQETAGLLEWARS